MKKGKMIYVYIAVVVVLFGTIFVLNQQGKNELYDKPVSELNPATRALLDNPNYQNVILPDELDSLVDSGAGSFVYFFASDCPHCLATTPQLMPIADELGIELPQFNLREFVNYYRDYNVEYTPTLAYFEGGEEVARLVGGIREGEDDSVGFSIEEVKAFLQDPHAHAGEGA